jgi:hypothetical protein
MDQQVYAMKIADIFHPEVKKKIIAGINKKIKSIFPSPDTLYLKDIVKKNEVNFTPLQIPIAINANTTIINSGINNNNSIININSISNTNTITNNSTSNSNSQTKKKLFEEDIQTPIKNKKHSSKFQYREKTLNNNSDLFSNYLKIDEDIDKSKYDISIGKSNINNNIIININQENDINSNESTSISSKDENNSLKINQNNNNNINNNEAKKEEKENISNDYIDIMKFNSDKSASEKNKIQRLFSKRESSRFEFVNVIPNMNMNLNINKSINNNNINNDFNTINININVNKNSNSNSIPITNLNLNEIGEKDKVDVPDFVFEIIKKKLSRQNFTKNINFEEDILYKDSTLENELNDSDEWAQYIYENKNIDFDKELMIDFDIINKSIKDKFTTFYLK